MSIINDTYKASGFYWVIIISYTGVGYHLCQ